MASTQTKNVDVTDLHAAMHATIHVFARGISDLPISGTHIILLSLIEIFLFSEDSLKIAWGRPGPAEPQASR